MVCRLMIIVLLFLTYVQSAPVSSSREGSDRQRSYEHAQHTVRSKRNNHFDNALQHVKKAGSQLLVESSKLNNVPGNKRVTLIRNSTLGFALAAGDSKTAGVLEGTRTVDVHLPGNAEEKVPDFILLDNVNSGAGIAIGGSLSLGVIKDSILAGKNPFWRRK